MTMNYIIWVKSYDVEETSTCNVNFFQALGALYEHLPLNQIPNSLFNVHTREKKNNKTLPLPYIVYAM